MATGLRADWRKLIDHSGSRSSKKAMVNTSAKLEDPTLHPTQPRTVQAIIDLDNDCMTPSSGASLTRPSSRASHTPSTSEGLDGPQDVWPPGAFDNDEDPSTLQAARAAKQTKAASTGTSTTHKSPIQPHCIRQTGSAAKVSLPN
jgi:hypothetical protein